VAQRRAAVQLAWGYVGQRRWADVQRCLHGLDESHIQVGTLARLARNLQAMRLARMPLYRQLVQAGPIAATHAYRFLASPSGSIVIARRGEGDQFHALSKTSDPSEAARKLLSKATASKPPQDPIVVSGFGDGYLISALTEAPPPPIGCGVRPVYLIEADPLLALAQLMAHDWSGRDQAIHDPRFHWFIGEDAPAKYEALLARDLMLKPPSTSIAAETESKGKVGQALKQTRQRVDRISREARRQVEAYYQTFTCEALTVGVGRRPRVLLLGSRFDGPDPADATTAAPADHPIAEAQQAFQRLGWRTMTAIEPSPAHRLTPASLRASLAHYKPDLVFSAGQLRSHYPEVFPENLPFCCWVPKGLHMRFTEAEPWGPRDLLLAEPGSPIPAALGISDVQVVQLPPFSRVPTLPEAWLAEGHDLVFFADAPNPDVQQTDDPLVQRCVSQLQQRFERNASLPSLGHLGRLIYDAALAEGRALSHRDLCGFVARLMPLHRSLYQQQTAAWAVEAAESLELNFAIFGKGWEQHAEFSRFAREPEPTGPERDQVLRNANLTLLSEPGLCLSVPLLRTLFAGGFTLIRHHPADFALPSLWQAQQTDDQPGVRSGKDFDQHLASAKALLPAGLGHDVDAKQWVNGCRDCEWIDGRSEPLEGYDQLQFSSSEELKARVQRWLPDPTGRQAMIAPVRETALRRLGGAAVMRRTLRIIGQRLSQASQSAKAA
jgi:hypothetical protein